jgi:LacI family transcriptional regulator
MAHLFELGHRRIGFVYGVSDTGQGIDRLDAYQQEIIDAGIPFDPSLIEHCGPLMEDGYAAAHRLLSRPDRPTALLAINDLLGMGVIRAAADLGLSIPSDVSIASFDDIPFSSFTVPRLTSVSASAEDAGRGAVQLLVQRLNEPDRPREIIMSKWELVIRESTGTVPTTKEG